MRIKVLSLFPKMFDGILNESIIKRAIDDKKVNIDVIDLRSYSKDKHNKVDDTIYGGGAGMLIKCEPVFDAIDDLKTKNTKVIMLSPDGVKYNQEKAYELSKEKNIILLCGHYEGFDERINTVVDEKISIGDYVLTGGEIPAMAIIDSVTRLLPGVINEESHLNDSFNNDLLDYPQYTKPKEYRGMKVPDVLLSGDHKKIDEWRREEQIKKTKKQRPDLLKESEEEKTSDEDLIKTEEEKENTETKRKQIGKYTLIDDKSKKKIENIEINDGYDFKPKNKIEKDDLASISKVVLVEPEFIETIAKKNINKKLNILLKQIAIVLNDETDDEGADYVLGEIDRLASLVMGNYSKYLTKEYKNLIKNKLYMLKEEINLKQMMRAKTVDYSEEKGRSL
ncbi:MAG: tRNA (guanosine(37)-N1)-methyltransferase TrmD [Bacilli bacterium]|jgi:tRNA (guanine37-N1)-methyltransferase|nr:tRNA (guanosine(37)-N1)-methyltransferase TrmD [Bacilli bacterium]HCJ31774.1 tRNA (guanosine(37)-N1)-methyltransferase TrmD [Bacillota bacterium]